MDDGALPVKAAIIGLGRMGRTHLTVLQQLGMEIVAAADIAQSAIAAAEDHLGKAIPAHFDSAAALIARSDFDALVIATTAPFHVGPVIAAAARGTRYILCEKPFATSIADGEAMIAACAASGTTLGVNHQMRFMDQYRVVRDLIGNAELGPLASVVVSGSNFGLAMNASHYFEAFRYLTGEPVNEISAWLESERLANPRGAEFSDASGRLLAMNRNGQSMSIDFSAKAGWGLRVCYICRNGQIQIDELSGEMEIWTREEAYRDLPTTRYGMPVTYRRESIRPADNIAPTRAVWEAMMAGTGYPSGQDGLHSLKCLVAAHLSHEANGQRVNLETIDAERARQFPWA
jgi:predicted dehydrogenase